ncbi:radical SAM protein [Saccharothrix obliqua]|uniref:radical SAM protein n=1 Tax=Saccharothrix obliqua TaxID=2861747 RepID=UPI001C5E5DCF|nr:radical SAM protein [Saccharothrix obliqua]MBW4717839.1 radical SAM protein [Saccharothrix obliqua]
MARQVHLVDLTSVAGMTYSPSLGYLQAAARSDPDVAAACTFHKHVRVARGTLFERVCADVLAAMHDPLVAAFSVYNWNRSSSLELARLVKRRWPECRIVLGGNDVSHQQDVVFAEAPWVDVLVHGEGELKFRDVLVTYLRGGSDLSGVAGVSFRRDGVVVTTEPAQRIADLATVPSPLLGDAFTDAELADTSMVIYETNRGCPYSCAFCYWGGAVNSKVRQFPFDRVVAELDRVVRCVRDGALLFLADANFGLLPRDPDIARALVALCRRHDRRLGFIAAWAKNTNDRVIETATVLHEAGLLKAVTLSAQSFERSALATANRSNLRPDRFRELHARFRGLGITTYTELIWGLPGETYDSFKNGVEEVLAVGGNVVVYPLQLLNNTEYDTDRFRAGHALTTRRIPADISNPELLGELVVAHSTMTEEDWLRGLELRLSLFLCQKTLLRATLRLLSAGTGVRVVDLCERLVRHLVDCPDPVVAAIARGYREAWRDPEHADRGLLADELGEEFLADDSHYPTEVHLQAIVHHLVRTPGALERFLHGAVDHLLSTVRPDRRCDVSEGLALDLAAASVFRAHLWGTPQSAEFSLSAATARLLRATGELPPGPEDDLLVGRFETGSRTVDRFSFSRYTDLVWRSLAHPLHDAVLTAAVPS